MSMPGVGARAQSPDPSTNSATDAIHTRFAPSRSDAQPASGTTVPSAISAIDRLLPAIHGVFDSWPSRIFSSAARFLPVSAARSASATRFATRKA